ncbi:hypothetical protein LTR84_010138 [Exophiala bonariae]|uniref:Uncharacterized protein n=1 Tax=Exophiala bonariae TaxID=1690606 RepID=A0AAV9NMS5_9EURO|nr:hypothetical protein LTR84_010138 [Exophiala bonariae]
MSGVVVCPAIAVVTLVELSGADEVVVDDAKLVLDIKVSVLEVSPTEVVISVVELVVYSGVVPVAEVYAAEVVRSDVEVSTLDVVGATDTSELMLDADEGSDETVLDAKSEVDEVTELNVEEYSIVLEVSATVVLDKKDVDVARRKFDVEVVASCDVK